MAGKKGKENAKWSGYHISLLMAPWMTAKEIIDKYLEVMAGKQTMDFFYNKNTWSTLYRQWQCCYRGHN